MKAYGWNGGMAALILKIEITEVIEYVREVRRRPVLTLTTATG
jgi:hypothetical protein